MMDNASKIGRNLTVIASNAGSITHWSWKWRELARESDRWSFHQYAAPAPWISSEELAEAEKRNPPSRFKRLYHGIWSSGSGDALSGEWIDRAIVLDGPTREHPGSEWVCVAGIDAGLTHDFAGLAVLAKHIGGYLHQHNGETRRMTRMERLLIDAGELLPSPLRSREQLEEWAERKAGEKPRGEYETIMPTGKVRLLHTRVWKPQGGEIDLSEIESEVLRCRKAFKLGRVAFDPWQLASPAQRLRRRGVRMEPVDPTGGNLTTMARLVMEGFRGQTAELYDDEALLRDLRSMSLVIKGGDRIAREAEVTRRLRASIGA